MSKRKRPLNAGLFHGYWLSVDGRKIRRVRREEISEAYRLWYKHADVRETAFVCENPEAQWIADQRMEAGLEP